MAAQGPGGGRRDRSGRQHKATGEYWAIQCKFYLPEHTLSKGDIDSFFTALGKPLLSKGIIVSTTDNWGKNAVDALNQTKSVIRIGIPDLEQGPIDWSKFDTRKPGQLKRTKKNSIRPHQAAALVDVIGGLAEADRGKLIMACGTGKTFTALKIAETLRPSLQARASRGTSSSSCRRSRFCHRRLRNGRRKRNCRCKAWRSVRMCPSASAAKRTATIPPRSPSTTCPSPQRQTTSSSSRITPN